MNIEYSDDIDNDLKKQIEDIKFKIRINLNRDDIQSYIFQLPDDFIISDDGYITNDLYDIREVFSNVIEYIKEQIFIQSDGRFTLEILGAALPLPLSGEKYNDKK